MEVTPPVTISEHTPIEKNLAGRVNAEWDAYNRHFKLLEHNLKEKGIILEDGAAYRLGGIACIYDGYNRIFKPTDKTYKPFDGEHFSVECPIDFRNETVKPVESLVLYNPHVEEKVLDEVLI